VFHYAIEHIVLEFFLKNQQEREIGKDIHIRNKILCVYARNANDFLWECPNGPLFHFAFLVPNPQNFLLFIIIFSKILDIA